MWLRLQKEKFSSCMITTDAGIFSEYFHYARLIEYRDTELTDVERQL
jgi:hypothetical protein